MNRNFKIRVKSYMQHSERILLVRIAVKLVQTLLIQVMPTESYSEEEIEEIYEEMDEVLSKVKGIENLIKEKGI
ncbi:hypothetical protein PGB90_002164 [Kerria lacca]